MKTAKKQLDRRSFLKITAVAGGGLMIGLYTKGELLAQGRGANTTPNNYITINPDNTFTLIAKNPETGQGMRNALPQLIADELDVDWSQVKVQQGDLDTARYGQGSQIEGGSTAIPSNYTQMRQVGAGARAVMIQAAAAQWSVPAAELTTGSGTVKHAASNRTATYASLVSTAANIQPPAPNTLTLKNPADFKIIGKPLTGVDNVKIVTGQPLFSIDQNPEGMLYAILEKSPVFGGRVISANLEDLKKLPGVKHAFLVNPAPAGGGAPQGGGGGAARGAAGGNNLVAQGPPQGGRGGRRRPAWTGWSRWTGRSGRRSGTWSRRSRRSGWTGRNHPSSGARPGSGRWWWRRCFGHRHCRDRVVVRAKCAQIHQGGMGSGHSRNAEQRRLRGEGEGTIRQRRSPSCGRRSGRSAGWQCQRGI
jgi:hypothetical protein